MQHEARQNSEGKLPKHFGFRRFRTCSWERPRNSVVMHVGCLMLPNNGLGRVRRPMRCWECTFQIAAWGTSKQRRDASETRGFRRSPASEQWWCSLGCLMLPNNGLGRVRGVSGVPQPSKWSMRGRVAYASTQPELIWSRVQFYRLGAAGNKQKRFF